MAITINTIVIIAQANTRTVYHNNATDGVGARRAIVCLAEQQWSTAGGSGNRSKQQQQLVAAATLQ